MNQYKTNFCVILESAGRGEAISIMKTFGPIIDVLSFTKHSRNMIHYNSEN